MSIRPRQPEAVVAHLHMRSFSNITTTSLAQPKKLADPQPKTCMHGQPSWLAGIGGLSSAQSPGRMRPVLRPTRLKDFISLCSCSVTR